MSYSEDKFRRNLLASLDNIAMELRAINKFLAGENKMSDDIVQEDNEIKNKHIPRTFYCVNCRYGFETNEYNGPEGESGKNHISAWRSCPVCGSIVMESHFYHFL